MPHRVLPLLALLLAPLLAILAATPAVPAPAVPAAPAPQRVVSLNLCVDQYLLALADREQIAALTTFATDPAMSAAAERAAGIPQIRGAAEEEIGRAAGGDRVCAYVLI